MQRNIQGVFGEKIADVSYNEPAEGLQIKRGVSDFTVEIPIKIVFSTVPSQLAHLRPILDTLWGDVTMIDAEGKWHNIGKILQLDFKVKYRPGATETPVIKWTGNVANLAFFEKIRNGGNPKFNLSVHGELYYLFETKRDQTPELKTEAINFWLDPEIVISKDIWIDRLRRINFLENMLIEIPLPISPPSPWEEVWKAIIEARDAFEQGGSTSWKNCVVACRLALENWQGIEKEDHGPGWTPPPPADRKLRTKEQRLDNIRWDLLQLAHYSAHSRADEWKREDALMVLSTLTALLAERNP